MRNAIRRLSAFVTATVLLSSTVMAMPGNTIIMKNKGFSIDAIFAGVDGIQEALDQSDGKLYYDLEGVTHGFQGLFNGAPMTETQKSELKDIEYTKGNGTKELYPTFTSTPVPMLTVVKASAKNSTTIEVTFSDEVTQEFSGYNLVVGDNQVQVQYKNKNFTVPVKYQPTQPSQGAVEKIEFVNYRNIRVTFNTVVDKVSAADPTNYYLEIVDGNAAYGVLPTLQDSNQLSKIETDYLVGTGILEAEDKSEDIWWKGKIDEDTGKVLAVPHIIANDVNGKTVVDIYLPEDARFTNVKDSDSGNYPYNGDWEDAERTLSVKLRDSKTDGFIRKALIKDMSVNVAVRNIKDTNGRLSIDTAVKPIRLLDEVKPELLKVNKIVGVARQENDEETTYTSLLRDLGCYDLLRTNKQKGQVADQLQFVYTEPVFDGHDLDKSDLEFYRDLQLYVNGKKVASLENGDLYEYMTFQMGADSTYEGSKTVTLDVEKAVKAIDEAFATGFEYIVRFIGVTDLAGNIEVSSEHSFKVKFHDDPVDTPAIVKPVVKDVVQVADNVLRIEFNRAGVEGKLVIENPDGEGVGLLKADIPASVEMGDTKHYYSYVAVPSWDHEPLPGLPSGVVQTDILTYDGQDAIYRNIRVEKVVVKHDDVAADPVLGDSFIKNNMKLVDDIKAPVALKPDEISYAKRGTTIDIPVKDITPWVEDGNIDYWVSPIAYVYNDNTQRFGNQIRINQENADTYLPIKVSYVDANGATHEAFVSNRDLRPYVGEPSDLNPGHPGNITFDSATDILTLDLSEYRELLVKEGGVFKLVPGVTYKVEIPKGYFTDSPKDINFWDNDNDFSFGGESYDVLNVDDGRDDDDSLCIFKIDAGLGYTSTEQTVDAVVEPKPIPDPDPEYVPQTSKQLINYDEPSNSLRIEFTGTIDVDTLKDKNNYILDGKTLAQWDNELGTNTEIEYVVDNSKPNDVHQYAVFEIPQDSIQEFGDYSFKVQGVSHPNGGTMTPVETVVRLHDNYRPVVVDAVVTGDRQIKLTFNEPIRYHVDPALLADPHSTANNFLVKIGGTTWTVDTAVLPVQSDSNREVILYLGNKIPDTGNITVEVVKDQNGNVLVIDFSTNKNPLKEAAYSVKRAE